MPGARFFDDVFQYLLADEIEMAVARGMKLTDACRESYGMDGGVAGLRARIRNGDLPDDMKQQALDQLDIEEARDLVAGVPGPYRRA